MADPDLQIDPSGIRFARRVAGVLLFSLLLLSACDHVTDAELQHAPIRPEPAEPAEGAETANAIRFSWTGNAPTGAFRLQVARDSLFTAMVTDAVVGSAHRYIVRELKRNQWHYWRVRHETTTDTGTWSSVRSFMPVRIARLPERPVLRAPADHAGPLPLEVMVEWESVPDAISYHLQVFMDEDLLLYQTDLDNLTATRFSMTDLVYTYPYWWRVRAQSVAGYGPWSSVWKFQIEDG